MARATPPASPNVMDSAVPLVPEEIRRRVEGIAVGETVYPLRHPLEGTYHSTLGRFWVDELTTRFLGQGESHDSAFADWQEQVHVVFQELYRKRPFEMTQEEKDQWAALERVIDIDTYSAQTPLVRRQLGHVVKARPGPYEIAWADDSTERVGLALMPSEFARFKPGQWFEALVERDRRTHQLRRVLYVQPVAPMQPLSGQELSDFWEPLPTTRDLPKSDTDWTKC